MLGGCNKRTVRLQYEPDCGWMRKLISMMFIPEFRVEAALGNDTLLYAGYATGVCDLLGILSSTQSTKALSLYTYINHMIISKGAQKEYQMEAIHVNTLEAASQAFSSSASATCICNSSMLEISRYLVFARGWSSLGIRSVPSFPLPRLKSGGCCSGPGFCSPRPSMN